MGKFLLSVGVVACAMVGAVIAVELMYRKKEKEAADEARDLTYDEIFCEDCTCECDGDCTSCNCPARSVDPDVEIDSDEDIESESAASNEE